MAIALNVYSGPYTANGSQTTFPFDFTAASACDVSVLVNGVAAASTLYTVTIKPDGTGSVTFSVAPALGSLVVPVLDPDFTQETIYENEGAYKLSTVNSTNRRDAIKAVFMRDAALRAIRVPFGETMPMLPAKASRAGKFLAFDADGNPYGSAGTGADATLRSDLGASGGAALTGFLQAGTGAVQRSVQSKLRDVVSVDDFGAVGDGIADDTVALQAALDSGAKDVFIPAGTYLVSSLLMPNVFGFNLRGAGNSSVLKQKAGATNALIRWSTAGIAYNEQQIRNLAFTGTNGSQHIIDTSGAGGVTLTSIYVTDVPVGKSAVYVNGAAGTYCHDARINDLQIYSGTAGHSGVRFGPLSADSEITDFIMNGNFVTSYCLYADIGAQSVLFTGGHPYNAAINVAYFAGTNNGFGFANVCFDNATNDLVYMTNVGEFAFTGCRFQATKSGYSGVNIAGTSIGVSFINGRWDGAGGALSCVVAAGTTSAVHVYGGQVPSIGNFTTPFNLQGTYSTARGVAGFNPLGLQWPHSGVQPSSQAQATTQYLGIGASTTEGSVEYLVPYDARLTTVYISTSTTPASGQTFTYQVRKNGVNIGSPLVVNNGSFGGAITLNTAFAKYDRFTISAVLSATSGSTTARWSAEFTA